MDALQQQGISFDLTPGVSSFCGAAAAAQAEYTLPGVSQTVIITRMAGRTPVPERENIASLAAHGATMVIFLSAGLLDGLQAELLKGAYTEQTPAALVYKATWPEEKVLRCPLGATASKTRPWFWWEIFWRRGMTAAACMTRLLPPASGRHPNDRRSVHRLH